MLIRIVGRGDAQSQRLESLVREVAGELHVKARFETADVDELPGGMISATPALMIDGAVKAAGRIPSKNEIGSWLQPSWL